MASLEKVGEWFFKNRSITPIPLIILMFVLNFGRVRSPYVTYGLGLLIILLGEFVRIWGVGVAGSITRTRKGTVRELVTSGPFAYVRNPLYLGNLLLVCGFVIFSQLLWLLPIAIVLFFVQYIPIVKFEERILVSNFKEEYKKYRSAVPAWLPSLRKRFPPSEHTFIFRRAIKSERNTLTTIVIVLAVLLVKNLLVYR